MWNYKVRTKQTVVLLALAGTLGWLPSHAGAQSGVATRARAAQAYSELPLRFEANAGQRGGQARFLSRGRGYTLFLTSSEAVLTLNKTALHMHLLGANANAEATGVDKLAGTVNYFLGNDPKKWRTNVPTYGKVEYRNVYSGVDLLYYGNQQQLEYDLVVAPGANPGVARLGIGGASKIQIDVSGDLVLQTLGGVVRLQKPVAYQRTPAANNQSTHGTPSEATARWGLTLALTTTASPWSSIRYWSTLLSWAVPGATPVVLPASRWIPPAVLT